MKKIHKFFAVGALGLLLTLALTPAALAFGTARAGRTASLPNTNVKGTPAHFSPTRLSAKARWNNATTCTTPQASFTVDNKKGVAETVTFSGAASGSVVVPAHSKYIICVTKGITGKMIGRLADGKKLTVHL